MIHSLASRLRACPVLNNSCRNVWYVVINIEVFRLQLTVIETTCYKYRCSQQRTFSYFTLLYYHHGTESVCSARSIEPEDSSRWSHQSAIGPRHKEDNSTPHPPLCLLRLIFVLSSPICLGLWSDVSLSGILTKYSLISPTHATWHAHLFLQAEDYIVFNFVLLFYRRNV
jgi:hypothetical protein